MLKVWQIVMFFILIMKAVFDLIFYGILIIYLDEEE